MPSSLGVAGSVNATVSFQAGLSGTYALSTPGSYLAGESLVMRSTNPPAAHCNSFSRHAQPRPHPCPPPGRPLDPHADLQGNAYQFQVFPVVASVSPALGSLAGGWVRHGAGAP